MPKVKGSLGSAGYACVIIAAVGVIAYANTLTGDFVWDDFSSVLLHEDVKDPNRIGQLFTDDQHAYGRGEGNFYRPLLSLTFMVDYQLATIGRSPADLAQTPPKVSPFIFHLTSIGWHIAAAIAIFFVLRVFRSPFFVQWAVPLVYVVHPLHTEAVAYISGRGDSMAAAFLFAGLAIAASLPKQQDKVIMRCIAVGICTLLASLSKESGMMIVPLVAWTALALGMARKPQPADEPSLGIRFAPAGVGLLALLAYFAARRAAITGGGEEAAAASSIVTRFIEAMQSLAVYAQLIVLPRNLHMERTLDGVPSWYAGIGVILIAILIATIAIAWKRGNERIVMAGGLFFITWFPISGIIPLNAPLAEHWMYVPLAGVLWLVAEGLLALAHAWNRPLVAPVFAGVAMLALLPVTVDRNEDWRDNITLFEATLEQNPNTIRVRQNLAIAQESVEQNLPAAVRSYRMLASYYDQFRPEGQLPSPEELEVHIFLGKSYLELDRPDAAIRSFQRVLVVAEDERYREFVAAAVAGIGEAYVDLGEIVQAERFLTQWIGPIPEIAEDAWRIMGGRGLAFQQRR